MKNVLIPTDFTLETLQLVNKTAEALKGEKFNAVLFHAFDLPDSIIDLMFIGREKIYSGLVSDDFRNQCKKVKNLYFETINSVCVKYMYGNTVRVFKNFADANNISLIVLPEELRLQLPHKYSMNPVSILKKSGLQLLSTFERAEGKVSVVDAQKKESFSFTQM
ncbi:hypothetical protein [Foetidibacter luteolus]|uniref:hypothetical protein n=1 Tax=Foetidibacter luteolus TaxID=2608880 RepID=UPI00129B3E19|nr:hypothetical protein [Foetidibacter luteolus]